MRGAVKAARPVPRGGIHESAHGLSEFRGRIGGKYLQLLYGVLGELIGQPWPRAGITVGSYNAIGDE